MTHLHFAFLLITIELNLAHILLFPQSSRVELPCTDRRAYKCAFVKCDLHALQKAESLLIFDPQVGAVIFERKMQWVVNGQFLTEFEVSFVPKCYTSIFFVFKSFTFRAKKMAILL